MGHFSQPASQPAISNEYSDHCNLASEILIEYLRSHFRFDLYAMQAEAIGKRWLYQKNMQLFAPHRSLVDVRAAYDAMQWATECGQAQFADSFFSERKINIVNSSRIPALNTYMATVLLEGTQQLFQPIAKLRNDQEFWLDHLPAPLAGDCPVHQVHNGAASLVQNGSNRTALRVIPLHADPLDWTPAADGHYYLFGARMENLAELPKFTGSHAPGLDVGEKNVCLAFSNLLSLKDSHKHIAQIGQFDMRHTPMKSHVLGLMLIEISAGGSIFADDDHVEQILNKWKNQRRRGVVGAQKDLYEAGRKELAQL